MPRDVRAYLETRPFEAVIAIAGVITVFAAGVAWMWHPEHLEPLGAVSAAVISVIGLVPGVLFLVSRQRPPFPFLALTGLFYSLFYGVAPLLVDRAWPPPGQIVMYLLPGFDHLSTTACGWSLVGLVLLLSGFWIGNTWLWRRVPSVVLPPPIVRSRLRHLAWIALTAHLAYVAIPWVRHLPSFGQLLDPLGFFAYGILFALHAEGKLPRRETMLTGLLLALEILLLLADASLAPVVFLIAFIGTIRIRMTGRIPWLTACLTFALCFVGYSVVSQLRYFKGPDSERVLALAQTSYRYLVGAEQPEKNPPTAANSVATQLQPVLRRMDLLVPFTVVVEKTPAQIEYWAGATYTNLLTSLVPRALWTGKPTERIGAEFGLRYGMIDGRDATSINLPWLVEFYANFGPAGVIGGMFAIGLLMALLDRSLNSSAMTSLEGVFGATIIFKLFYQEANFSLMAGSLIQLGIALWIYLRIGLTLPAPRRGR